MGTDGDSCGAGDSDAVGGCAAVTVHVRCSNGSKFSVQIALDSTVGAFKAALVEKCDVPAEQQRLIYKGRILKDEHTLESYGLESDHTIHLVRGLTSPAASADVTTASNGASRIPANSAGVENGGTNEGRRFGGADIGGSLFPGLGVNRRDGNGSGFLGFGLPDINQMQQQLAQNPSMMREIMNMPAVQSLMNNPDLLRNMIMNNPQMREIIDRNPDFAHVLNDPSTLRQSLEVMRNPELMRELMRNTDRAMSNIEASPEGFNALRRMYETVQEPFLNATTGSGNMGNDLAQNPFAALLGNQSASQARDQTANQSGTGSDVTTESAAPNSNPLPNPWSSTAGGAQSTNSRPVPANDGRSPGVAGLGGLGLPDLERMAGGMPDPSVMNQLLQNPAIMQMMQSLLSNPQFMNQVLDPQLGGMLGSNSQLRDMLQNPELIRQLTSPETLQQLLSFQQSLVSQVVRQQSSQEQNQTGSGTAVTMNNNGLELLMNMFGGLGSGAGVPSNPDVPREERYATQLSQLQEMGFLNTQENIRALSATSGNVHAAVDWLLRNLDR
ncbi:ubiquitin domain-containing protein DSK2a-like isoform X1 [Musa acuminata AAA Group]|uniref:ubiquitin domain-containing protein DSK2a-like isoform X1 n=1 Tax=Musa acuminata AAA Group TaxID=214697 RepID=UPI0031D7BBDF